MGYRKEGSDWVVDEASMTNLLDTSDAYHTLRRTVDGLVKPGRMGFLIESRLKETLAEIDQKLDR